MRFIGPREQLSERSVGENARTLTKFSVASIEKFRASPGLLPLSDRSLAIGSTTQELYLLWIRWLFTLLKRLMLPNGEWIYAAWAAQGRVTEADESDQKNGRTEAEDVEQSVWRRTRWRKRKMNEVGKDCN